VLVGNRTSKERIPVKTFIDLMNQQPALHFEDIRNLLDGLNKLVDRGNTAGDRTTKGCDKSADHIIDIDARRW